MWNVFRMKGEQGGNDSRIIRKTLHHCFLNFKSSGVGQIVGVMPGNEFTPALAHPEVECSRESDSSRFYQANSRIAKFFDYANRIVRGAVVDDDAFKIGFRLREYALHGVGDVFLSIVRRHQYAYHV